MGKHGGRIYDFVEFSSLWQRWLLELLQGAIGGAIPYGKIEYFYDKVNGKEVRVKEHPYAYAHFTPASLLYAYGNLIENHRSFTDQHAPENGYRDFIAS